MTKNMRTWTTTNGVEIEEIEWDYSLHAFLVRYNGEEKTVTPDSIEDMQSIIEALDAGADPIAERWEDGLGNPL